jgi:hypothetical protein
MSVIAERAAGKRITAGNHKVLYGDAITDAARQGERKFMRPGGRRARSGYERTERLSRPMLASRLLEHHAATLEDFRVYYTYRYVSLRMTTVGDI